MRILYSMHINCQLLDALLKIQFLSRSWSGTGGRLVTPQILTSSSLSLVEETHGSSGLCGSFSLIDVGGGFTTYIVFLFSFSTPALLIDSAHRNISLEDFGKSATIAAQQSIIESHSRSEPIELQGLLATLT